MFQNYAKMKSKIHDKSVKFRKAGNVWNRFVFELKIGTQFTNKYKKVTKTNQKG